MAWQIGRDEIAREVSINGLLEAGVLRVSLAQPFQ
jgi:hypothetical protein